MGGREGARPRPRTNAHKVWPPLPTRPPPSAPNKTFLITITAQAPDATRGPPTARGRRAGVSARVGGTGAAAPRRGEGGIAAALHRITPGRAGPGQRRGCFHSQRVAVTMCRPGAQQATRARSHRSTPAPRQRGAISTLRAHGPALKRWVAAESGRRAPYGHFPAASAPWRDLDHGLPRRAAIVPGHPPSPRTRGSPPLRAQLWPRASLTPTPLLPTPDLPRSHPPRAQ